MKSALKAIRERGLGTFLRELKEEGYLSVSLSSYLFNCIVKSFNRGAFLMEISCKLNIFANSLLGKSNSEVENSYGDHISGNISQRVSIPCCNKSYVCLAASLSDGNAAAIPLLSILSIVPAVLKDVSMQTKIHNIGATLVGVDKFGNKYYQKLGDTQYGRHRWVEYAEKGRYNASQVPAEWHGWLHFITDHTGDEASLVLKYYMIPYNVRAFVCLSILKKVHLLQLLMLKPKRYGLEHKENLSGEGDEYIYHSKGHALNPGQRDWSRYQPWQPTKAE
ncbi:hypothetical protein JRO89_XS04G0061200 [Xanthoceras sorbifolium]|uniref:NADH dehydrogenase [ubiquinone] 1 alpha subcomplex subunit 12 n=1 Tax=Xanthoceras sorbifolium TaxID=99658 RepID=A0ABQ8I4C1_9ROSI|nr:hypothetical protein JRO89_XS04G0061200 [Xanthoceras sorbifolium]